MNTSILLSGGIGSRLHSDVPKQYLYVDKKMLITYALDALVKSPRIDQICIVAEEEWRDDILSDATQNGISTHKVMGFALPGFNRQASIINGMREIMRQISADVLNDCPDSDGKRQNAIDGDLIFLHDSDTVFIHDADMSFIRDADTVLIHDAARPLLSQKQVAACYDALEGHDGVMPALPMKDTVYLSQNGKAVSQLLDRSQIFAGQAPELFRFKKYYQANMALSPERLSAINGSAEPAVLVGMDIAMIPGDEKNFKITTHEDLERFRSIIDGEREKMLDEN